MGWVRPLWRVATALVLTLLLFLGAWLALHQAWVTAPLLSWLPGLKVVEPHGALMQGFRAQRVELALSDGTRLILLDPQWEQVSLVYDESLPWLFGLHVDAVSARSLDLHWVSSASASSNPPTQLGLPLSIQIDSLKVKSLRSNLIEPQVLSSMEAQLFLQEPWQGRHRHLLALKHIESHGWKLSGVAAIQTDQKLLTELDVHAERLPSSQGLLVGDAHWVMDGPLASLKGAGRLEVKSGANQAQSLNLTTEVKPFELWPLVGLKVQAQRLDLGLLWPSWPRTALSGQALIAPTKESKGRAIPDLSIDVSLSNAMAGAVDAHALPVLAAKGQIELPVARVGKQAGQLSSLGQAGRIALNLSLPRRFAASAPATVQMSGGWNLLSPQQTNVNALVSGIDAQALDGRAPDLQQVRGRVELRSAPAAGQAWERWSITAGLNGLFAGKAGGARSAQSVNADMLAYWMPSRTDIEQLRLSSGPAQALLTGQLEHAAGQRLQAKGRLDLSHFDPQLWMPWPQQAGGVTRLQGQLLFDLDEHGQGDVSGSLQSSVLAGVALDGHWQWHSPPGSPDASLVFDFDLAGNHLEGQGTLPFGSGGATPVSFSAQAQLPTIKTLQPMAQALGWTGVQGKAQLKFNVGGIWPKLTTQGYFSLNELQATSPSKLRIQMDQAQGQWQLHSVDSLEPSQAHVEVRQARIGSSLMDQLSVNLDGTAQSHRLTAKSDWMPPSRDPLHWDLALTGGFNRALDGWAGKLQHLKLTEVADSSQPLLLAESIGLRGDSFRDENKWQVSPSQLQVLGATLSLQELTWSAHAARMNIDLAPLKLADALKRWHPETDWGGDLVVTGHFAAHRAEHQPWVVDGFIARRDGDLTFSEASIDGNTVQSLGIRQARMDLTAKEGTWSLVEVLEGRILGLITAKQTIQARAAHGLPSASDPLSGVLDVKIANLRPWAVWAPPGWRLSGQLGAQATLSGTLGSPMYKGQIQGQALGASNALQGINLSNGQLQLELDGDRARLTQFKAQGGDHVGTLSIEGQATLGAQPQAKLNVLLDHFALLQQIDRRAILSGQAQVVFRSDEMNAEGRFNLDEGLIDISRSDAPTLGDDVNVINRPGSVLASKQGADSAPVATPKHKVHLSLGLDLGTKLRLKGQGLDVQLTGKLQLTTPNGQAAVHGAIKTASGTYVAYAQKLLIERGSITFNGPVDNPRLDILAMRAQAANASESDVKVGVTITGSAQEPRVRLYSDPNLSETEKLSWLVLGRGPAGLAGADIGLLQTAASALLAGEGGTPKDALLTAIGLDDLSVHQSDGDVRDTVVNVGKQISRKWYLGYERSLNATAGNWQLIYRLAQRYTLRAQAGQDNALDLLWSWQFD